MKVLVTGGTGYIGSAIVEALVRSGHDVGAVVRNLTRAPLVERHGARAVEGDIARPETLASELSRVDAVVHAASDASGDGAMTDRRFVEQVLASTHDTNPALRFVYTSGLWVLGNTGADPADEATPATAPAALVAWRPEVERLVSDARSNGLATWTIRPGIVYGGSGGITRMMFETATKEQFEIVGDGSNHWSLVHRDDLADLYLRVVERAPRERLLHATDGSRFTVSRIAGAMSHAAGAGGNVISTPLDVARETLGPFADALALDQRVSAVLARDAVDWHPSHQ